MCLGQEQNQVPYVGAGVFLTSLFLYIIICNVGLAGKPGPRTVFSWPLLFVPQEMLTVDKAVLFQGLHFFGFKGDT